MIKDPTGSLDLVGVFTTAAASILAWSQAKRHDELRASYALAHEELCSVKDRVANTKTEDAFLEAVIDGESAISREHTMWVAKSGSTALWKIRTDA